MKVPTFTTPGLFKTPDSASPYVPVGDGVVMAGSATADLYQKIRQAKLENAVVLEVLGDDQPIRVLPLPPGGRSVFVSALLKQTGVLEKLGSIDATLFRASTDSIAGIRMEVGMNDDGDQIRPECDYALQPGDRLQVKEREINGVNMMMSMLGI